MPYCTLLHAPSLPPPCPLNKLILNKLIRILIRILITPSISIFQCPIYDHAQIFSIMLYQLRCMDLGLYFVYIATKHGILQMEKSIVKPLDNVHVASPTNYHGSLSAP